MLEVYLGDSFFSLFFVWKQTVKNARNENNFVVFRSRSERRRPEQEITTRHWKNRIRPKNEKRTFFLALSSFFFSTSARSLSLPLSHFLNPLFLSTLFQEVSAVPLLVDPLGHVRGVLGQPLGEPERDLALGSLDGVGAVDDVAADAVLFFVFRGFLGFFFFCNGNLE